MTRFVCFLALFLGPLSFDASSESPKTYHVGGLLPLTGSAADQGEWGREGLQLALEISELPVAKRVKLSLEDTGADPKRSLSVYRKLQQEFPLSAIITYGSAVGVALSPVVNADKVIQIGAATATPSYRSADDYTFRTFPSAELETRFLATSLLDRFETREVALVKIDNEYGEGTAGAFRKLFTEIGGTIVFEESLEPNGNDYRAVIERIRQRDPKWIVLVSYPQEGAIFLKQSRELALKSRVLASSALIGTKNFIPLAGGGAEGLLVASSVPAFLDPSNFEAHKFATEYEKRFREAPNVQHLYAARAFDAMNLVLKELAACEEKGPECSKNTLFGIENYHGASGTFSFDKFGDIQSDFALYEIRNGKYTLRE